MRMLLQYSLLGMSFVGLLAAQRGGGHAGGGGGHSSGGYHASASRSFGGYSSYNTAHPNSGIVQSTGIGPSVYNPGGYRYNSLSSPIVQSTGIGPSVYNSGRYGRSSVLGRPGRYRGYGLYGVPLYPYLGYGYYDGFGDTWDNSYNYPPEQYYNPYAAGPDPNVQQGLPNDYYPPIPYAMDPQGEPMPAPAPPPPPSTPITLVLRNGQKLEVQNYAIMNGIFWDFSKQNAKKIPLLNIDEAASAKATEDAGGAFPEESFATNPK